MFLLKIESALIILLFIKGECPLGLRGGGCILKSKERVGTAEDERETKHARGA